MNINPAYKSHELEFALNKSQCKGIIMSETYKSQDYIELLSSICPELDTSKIGNLHSKLLPSLKNVIVISEKEYK